MARLSKSTQDEINKARRLLDHGYIDGCCRTLASIHRSGNNREQSEMENIVASWNLTRNIHYVNGCMVALENAGLN